MRKNMHFFLVLALLSSTISCKKRTFHSNTTNVSLRNDIATVDWACSGTGKQHPVGYNSQEEYCEWTRQPIVFSGHGKRILTDGAESLNLAQACLFTTSFDQTRSFYLTHNVLGKDKSQSNPFWATQFNSYAFLVGGREPDSGIERKGIIGHCISGESCYAPNCVPDRASDPQICRALNQFGERGCKIDMDFEIAPVITSKSVLEGHHGDRVVKPRLSVRPTIASHCWYVEDKNISENLENTNGQRFNPEEQRTLVACDARALNVSNCDAIAPDIASVVALRIEDVQCIEGKKSQNNPNANAGSVQPKFGEVGVYCKIIAGDGPANVRAASNSYSEILAKLDPGFEVFIRGFKVIDEGGNKNRWVSVQFVKDNKKYGAGDGLPSFIHESQFDLQCRR